MTDIDLSGDRSRNEWGDIALQHAEEKEQFNRLSIPEVLAEDVGGRPHEQVPRREEWRIAIDGDQFHFCRYINGRVNESYRIVDAREASVWATAVIQGFQPPRRLWESDRPVG